MSETVYFEGPSARIGNAWFVLRRGAYRVADVHSIELRRVNSNRGFWHRVIIPVILFVGAISSALQLGESFSSDFFPVSLVCTVPLLLILALITPYMFYTLYVEISGPRSIVYLITLRGSFGESTAFASLDKSYSEQIAAMMREALDNKILLEETSAPPSTSLDPVSNASLIANTAHIPDNLVTITPLEVKFGDTGYSIPTIKVAKINAVPFNKVDDWFDAIILISLVLWAAFILAPIKRAGYPDTMYEIFSNLRSILPITYLILFWVKMMRKSLQAHIIELSGAFGRVNVFVTLDEQQAGSVLTTINGAIKRHKVTVASRTA